MEERARQSGLPLKKCCSRASPSARRELRLLFPLPVRDRSLRLPAIPDAHLLPVAKRTVG